MKEHEGEGSRGLGRTPVLIVPGAGLGEPVRLAVTGALVVPMAPEAGGGWGVALLGTGDVGAEYTLRVGERDRADTVARVLNGS